MNKAAEEAQETIQSEVSNAELDDDEVLSLLSFFILLDKWGKEAEHNAKIM